MPRTDVLVKAQYDPKLKTYLFLLVGSYLVFSVIGIVLLPFWAVLGHAWSRRFMAHLSCELTERALVTKKGIWFRSETTIPLAKIQDLSLIEGPLLRKLGLAQLKIETAGQRSEQGTPDATLIGIVDTVGFRDRILEQRDAISGEHRPAAAAPTTPEADTTATDVLREMRDILLRIERRLEAQPADAAREPR